MARTRILSIFFVRELFVSPEPLLPFFKPSGHLSSCKKREKYCLINMYAKLIYVTSILYLRAQHRHRLKSIPVSWIRATPPAAPRR